MEGNGHTSSSWGAGTGTEAGWAATSHTSDQRAPKGKGLAEKLAKGGKGRDEYQGARWSVL